ncbi:MULTISPECIES: PadR family transcriptional regulator [Paenibacillus]|uniref:PadR family transcriptional regulator n=1 Tax=Paenibacillus TaxID=44249 RepID=UPI0012677988|nr:MULTISPECIES: helix-turn-helix transcriptional regulator [Paenibacillus]GIO64746.1 PadR family transcriptional regulator [Paenibacillus cineris]
MDLEKAIKRYIPMSETMFYILLSLQTPNHGYGIMQHVKEKTNGRITLGAGTIYQSLGKLDGDRLIEAVKEEDRKKIYQIGELGMRILKIEAERIAELYHNSEGLR